MKLYELNLDNGLSYEDYLYVTKWIVASNETEANERGKKELKEFMENDFTDVYASYSLEEVTEVDGYKIIVKE